MISIVIVNWNSGKLLEGCIRSLASESCEITVVDNASQDGSLDFLESETRATVLRSADNAGFGAANNRGWRNSRGNPVLFLNPDIEAFPGSISALSGVLIQDLEIWAAGGLPVDKNGKPQVDAYVKPFPTLGGVAAEMFFLEEIWPGNPWTRRVSTAKMEGTPVRTVDQPAAACLMIRREVLEELGGFDENFAPAWFEDVDLCKRIRDRGGKVVLHTGARFLHLGGASVARIGYEAFVKIFRRNQIRYFEKHGRPGTAKSVRRLLVAGMFLRASASLLVPVVPGATRIQSAKLFWGMAREISTWSIE
jgi:GT2 family glycosyltransferase